jgi:thioredoxin reductase
MDFLMALLLEEIIVYGVVFLVCILIVWLYLRKHKSESKIVKQKVEKAKEEGLFEPVSLHPYIDLTKCIGSGACVSACPEKDILGLVNGVGTVINTSQCVGHGACFHACPVEAITLRIGTETRGVDLPHVNEKFETNISGIYIAGELGGMGLIKNSVEQGKQAMENLVKTHKKSNPEALDAVIIGAGPAGISASLTAKKHGLRTLTLEQDSLGGTVYTFPRSKIVMTAPMDLPLVGKVKLYNTSKDELLQIWKKAISENDISIRENTKAENIVPLEDGTFRIDTNTGESYLTNNVFLTIGRRGSPRKLNVPGEDSQKVAYRLLEPERISGKKVLVVGGGDSAVESAMLLMDQNEVILSYRNDQFSRLKRDNKMRIAEAMEKNALRVIFNSNVISINDNFVIINIDGESQQLENDLVYIFAGGELPTKFLEKIGIQITKRFGHVMKKHK